MLPFHVNVPTGTAIVDKRLLHSRLPSVLILTLSEPSSVLSPQPRFRIGMQGCRGCAHTVCLPLLPPSPFAIKSGFFDEGWSLTSLWT